MLAVMLLFWAFVRWCVSSGPWSVLAGVLLSWAAAAAATTTATAIQRVSLPRLNIKELMFSRSFEVVRGALHLEVPLYDFIELRLQQISTGCSLCAEFAAFGFVKHHTAPTGCPILA